MSAVPQPTGSDGRRDEDRFDAWVDDGGTDDHLAPFAELDDTLRRAILADRSPERLEFAARSAFREARRKHSRFLLCLAAAVAAIGIAVGSTLQWHEANHDRDAALAKWKEVASECDELRQAKDAAERERDDVKTDAAARGERDEDARAELREQRDRANAELAEARRQLTASDEKHALDAASTQERHDKAIATASAYSLVEVAMPARFVGPVGGGTTSQLEPTAWRAIAWIEAMRPEDRGPVVRQLLRSFPLRLEPVEAQPGAFAYNLLDAAFGPDGAVLVTDTAKRLSSIACGETGARPAWTHRSRSPAEKTLQLVVSADGSRAVLKDEANRVRTWTATAPTATDETTPVLATGVGIIAVSATGDRIAAIDDERVRLLDPAGAVELELSPANVSGAGGTLAPQAAQFSADGLWLVVEHVNRAIVYDLRPSARHRVLAEGAAPASIATSPDSAWVAIVERSVVPRSQQRRSRATIESLAPSEARPSRVDLIEGSTDASAPRQVLFLGPTRVAVRTHDRAELFSLGRVDARATWSRTGTRVAASSQAADAATTPTTLDRLVRRPGARTEVLRCFSDGTLDLWDVDRDQVVALPRAHRSPIAVAAFSADGTKLVSAAKLDNRTIQLWTLDPTDAAVEFYARAPRDLIGAMVAKEPR